MKRLNGFQKGVIYLLIATFSYASFGCASYTSAFVYKSEKELEQMEQQSARANEQFNFNRLAEARSTVTPLTVEQTVSRPLYQLELLSILLMEGVRDQAHQLMVDIQRDLELLFDPKSEALATSFWHGETNKVFKGDTHERALFYAFFAMSFIERGEYEDALRCVKNGLLADISTEANEHSSDFALLHYLGYIAARYHGDDAAAAEYKREYLQALQLQKLPASDATTMWHALVDEAQLPNAFLVLWSGTPPTYHRGGAYEEIRHVIPGSDPLTMMTVEASNATPILAAKGIGDVNYQATTRGGREMDEVLANKALLKSGLEASGNIFIIAGVACLFSTSSQSDARAQAVLAVVGLGCLALGSGFYAVGACVNSEADIRAWKNLPANLSIIPLTLPKGEHPLTIRGYYGWDNVLSESLNLTITNDKPVVLHRSLLPYNHTLTNAFTSYLQQATEKAKNADNFSHWNDYEICE